MKMTKEPHIIWRGGPPPSIGWWPASFSDDENCFRWWSGKTWSDACYASMSAKTAARKSKLKCYNPTDGIRWTVRPSNWPARSYT